MEIQLIHGTNDIHLCSLLWENSMELPMEREKEVKREEEEEKRKRMKENSKKSEK